MHSLFSSCAERVGNLWNARAQVCRLTHRRADGRAAWVQSYGFMDRLYQKSTQVLPSRNLISVSVKVGLSLLSTQPIKTPTNYIYLKGL